MSEILARLGPDPAATLGALCAMSVYPRSLAAEGDSVFFLGRGAAGEHRLGVLAADRVDAAAFALDWRSAAVGGATLALGVGAADHANATALRARLPFTAPVRVGLRTSAGLGDRLGTATPGHLRAMRHVHGIVPVLVQQSIREMERTARTPDEVMDAATWGVFQEGWRGGYGADADHLKTEADIDLCAAAGYVMYTLDPRDHVDNDAETEPLDVLSAKYERLPWADLAVSPQEMRARYLGRAFPVEGDFAVAFDETTLLRAACKYGRALAHLARLYRHLVQAMGARPFELEVSVDEADTPTTPEEHYFIAAELRRLGVEWVSLAPRYIGRFEKGVDYIGDLARFEADFARHAAVARALGPYKLSLHSGSDKFSIYPIAARLAGELVHLKTAGTSYLEALRAVAGVDPALFREILAFAIAHYEQDRASYHVSAEMSRAPRPEDLADAELPAALDQFDARQALHVTFGTVLTLRDAAGAYVFRDRLYAVLAAHEEAHYDALERHLTRHVLPFSR